MANLQVVNLDAELKAAQALKPACQTQAGTKGCLKNNTCKTMKFEKSHDWDGSNSFDMPYPPVIQPNQSGYFIHVANTEKGSKEAFIYKTTCCCSPTTAYLVAYSAPHNRCGCSKNRVYVECGSPDKFENIDWSALEAKLDNATDEASFKDDCTKTFVNAKIDDGREFASLAAAFGATA